MNSVPGWSHSKPHGEDVDGTWDCCLFLKVFSSRRRFSILWIIISWISLRKAPWKLYFLIETSCCCLSISCVECLFAQLSTLFFKLTPFVWIMMIYLLWMPWETQKRYFKRRNWGKLKSDNFLIFPITITLSPKGDISFLPISSSSISYILNPSR